MLLWESMWLNGLYMCYYGYDVSECMCSLIYYENILYYHKINLINSNNFIYTDFLKLSVN